MALAIGTRTPMTSAVVCEAPPPKPTSTPAAPVRIRWRAAWCVAQPPTMTGASSSWMNSLRFSGSLSDEDTCSAETVVPRMTTMSAPAWEAMGASRAAPWGDVATATVTPAARRSVMRARTRSASTGRAAYSSCMRDVATSGSSPAIWTRSGSGSSYRPQSPSRLRTASTPSSDSVTALAGETTESMGAASSGVSKR